MHWTDMFGRATAEELEGFDALETTWILSAGRTGTQFFGERLGSLLPDTLSVHEPDRVDPGRVAETWSKLRQQGPRRLILGKALGLFGTRNLSLARIVGRLDAETVWRRLVLERRWVLASGATAYLESNPQLFGLGTELAARPRSRVVLLVRDPRSWLPSWMGKRWFSSKDWMERVNLLGFKRLNPRLLGQSTGWDSWSPLQKLAWTWNEMNRRLLEVQQTRPDRCRLIRFEDLFVRRRPEVLEDFLAFVSRGRAGGRENEALVRAMKDKVNARRTEGPRLFEDWAPEEQQALRRTCGELAAELGYDLA